VFNNEFDVLPTHSITHSLDFAIEKPQVIPTARFFIYKSNNITGCE